MPIKLFQKNQQPPAEKVFHKGVTISLDELVKLRFHAQSIRFNSNKIVASDRTGEHRSHLRGRGMDFDEVRIYQPGDDPRRIDWRVTARTGKPHTKLYHDERERPIFLLVDYGASLFFGSRVAFKSVIAAQVAALLGWAAIHHGDHVGALIFSGEKHIELPPTSRQAGLLPILHALVNNASPHSLYTKENALSKALRRVRKVARPGSLIFIISDFVHVDEGAKQSLSQLVRHNDVIAAHISDPLEREAPPPNRYTVTDGLHRSVMDTTNKQFCRDYHDQYWEQFAALKTLLNKRSIPLLEFSTDTSILDVIGCKEVG